MRPTSSEKYEPTACEADGIPWRRWSLVLAGALLLLSLPFWLFPELDIAISRSFYQPGNGWPLERHPLFFFPYQWGPLPAVVLGLVALSRVAMSYLKPHWRRLRKPAIFLLLALALGPGLVVNAAFKEHFGRPRPREVQALGGKEAYQPLLVPRWGEGGKSFPSGHASIGFYLAVPALLYWRRRRRIAWLWLAAGLLWGSWLGLARIVAGGHFASDTLWAAGLVGLCGLVSYGLVRPHRPLRAAPSHRGANRVAATAVGLLMLVLMVAAALATPYLSTKDYRFPPEHFHEAGVKQLSVEAGAATLILDWRPDTFRMLSEVTGFGLPTSKLRRRMAWSDSARLSFSPRGFFTELRHTLRLSLSPAGPKYRVHLQQGSVYLEAWPRGWEGSLEITVEKGHCYLGFPPDSLPRLRYQGRAPWPEGLSFQGLANPTRAGELVVKTPKGGLRLERP